VGAHSWLEAVHDWGISPSLVILHEAPAKPAPSGGPAAAPPPRRNRRRRQQQQQCERCSVSFRSNYRGAHPLCRSCRDN